MSWKHRSWLSEPPEVGASEGSSDHVGSSGDEHGHVCDVYFVIDQSNSSRTSVRLGAQ